MEEPDDACGDDERNEAGDDGDENHLYGTEQGEHDEGDEEDGQKDALLEVDDEEAVALEEDEAAAGDFYIEGFRREDGVDSWADGVEDFFHADGTYIGHLVAYAGVSLGGIDEGMELVFLLFGAVHIRFQLVKVGRGREDVVFRVAIVKGLVGELYGLYQGVGFGEIIEFGHHLLQSFGLVNHVCIVCKDAVVLFGVDGDFEWHDSFKVLLEELQVLINGVLLRNVVHHIRNGMYKGDAINGYQGNENHDEVYRLSVMLHPVSYFV